MATHINPAVLRTASSRTSPLLPKEGEINILITSALPYCNNVPHLGNIIGSTLSADVFSRYNRARNRRTLYVCGTDEYGTATETQALKEGITPKELCDKYHLLHKETYEWFELDFDKFGRTSTPQHTEISQEIYSNILKNNLFVKQTKEQTYCENCSKFLADRFVEGTCPHCGYEDARGDQCDGCSRTLDAIELVNPRCLIDRSHKITTKPSSHMYLRLDAIQPKTEDWIRSSWREGKWSANSVINADGEIVDARLKGGLRPSPVTRDLTWGVPVPISEGSDADGMAGKVLYVWFDAPIGYPSITATLTPEWKQWWFNHKDVRLYQFMGKDNVYFHTVFWPSVQLADGRPWTTLHHLSTTEFLNYEGGKFSKSRNYGVFGPAARETGVPASVWRYYLLASRPETSDSMFSWNEFIAANNGVLLNNFGNFINRALKFISAKCGGIVPDGGDTLGPLRSSEDGDEGFIADVNDLLATYIEAMESVKLRSGLQTVMLLSARGNLYLQQAGLSNALLADNPQRCAQVLCRALNLIYALSAVVEPFMPSTAASILDQLQAPSRTIPEVFSIDILPGHKLGNPVHLFKKIEEKSADVWRARFGGVPKPPTTDSIASKKKAANKGVGKPAIATSAEALKLEAQVKSQGDRVRAIKEGKGEAGDNLPEALAELLRLKARLGDALERQT